MVDEHINELDDEQKWGIWVKNDNAIKHGLCYVFPFYVQKRKKEE